MAWYFNFTAFEPPEPWIHALSGAVDRNDLGIVKALLDKEDERQRGNLGRPQWKKEDHRSCLCTRR